MSVGFKYDEINDFYMLLSAFIKRHEGTNTETENHKNSILNNVKQLCNKYLDSYKKNYDKEKAKDEEKGGGNYKQFGMIKNQNQLKKKRPRQKKPDEIQKPS